MIKLPYDLGVLGTIGQGCSLLVEPLLVLNGGLAGSPVPIAVPIPADASLAGLGLYGQAIAYDGRAGRLAASNGWAMSLGN